MVHLLDHYIYAFGITLLKNSFKILESAEASIRLDLPALPAVRFVTFCIKTKSK